MDVEQIAWVNASSENPSGKMANADKLTDSISQWANSLKTLAHQTVVYENAEIIEFAAPVMFEDEIMGVIRYGFNTKSMHSALKQVAKNGVRARNQMMGILLLLGIISLVITYLVIRRLAATITQPIASLVQSANTISNGNYTVEIQAESNDEIGSLAKNFESMRVMVKKYTEHLQELVDEKMQQVNDILNNIDHGLFTVNLDGSVNKEYSARANEILKVQDVASNSVENLLRLDTKQQRAFHVWMDVVYKKHQNQRWKKLARLAPVHELVFDNHDSIPEYVSVAYQKIYDKDNELSKIMILTTDETEKRLKEQQIEEQRKEHENEMHIVLELANTPPEEISAFMEDTMERMQKIRQALREQSSSFAINPNKYKMTDKQLNAIYGDVHTIKGNSGSYGFNSLSGHTHELEDLLEKLRDSSHISKNMLSKLTDCLNIMNEDIKNIQQKIKLIFGREEYVTMRVPASLVTDIMDTCSTVDKTNQPPPIQSLIDKCTMLSWIPMETISRKYQKIVNKIARQQHKHINFIAKPEHIFFPTDIFVDIDDILIHLVRNSADHGIESPEIREEFGKGKGNITFEFITENNKRKVIITDDGKGIDIEKLEDVCIKKGVITPEKAACLNEQEKLNLIFIAGISTSDNISNLSGRGIGMNVVQEKVESIGGTISIDSYLGTGTTITLVLPSLNK
jgi:signal transduction histidine kinase/HAMP domain-containing protein